MSNHTALSVPENLASQEAAKRRQQTNKTTSNAQGDLKLGITLEESIQILNVKKELNVEEIEKNYKHLFEVNSKEKGGSFYLQSKVCCLKYDSHSLNHLMSYTKLCNNE